MTTGKVLYDQFMHLTGQTQLMHLGWDDLPKTFRDAWDVIADKTRSEGPDVENYKAGYSRLQSHCNNLGIELQRKERECEEESLARYRAQEEVEAVKAEWVIARKTNEAYCRALDKIREQVAPGSDSLDLDALCFAVGVLSGSHDRYKDAMAEIWGLVTADAGPQNTNAIVDAVAELVNEVNTLNVETGRLRSVVKEQAERVILAHRQVDHARADVAVLRDLAGRWILDTAKEAIEYYKKYKDTNPDAVAGLQKSLGALHSMLEDVRNVKETTK